MVWLLFRLIFASGLVKLTSGDAAWANATASIIIVILRSLDAGGVVFQQLPSWWQALSAVMFLIELVLPFMLFGPRRARLFAVAGIVFLQLLIALTGNYGFFNLLTLISA